MKKFIIIIALCLLAVNMSAGGNGSHSLEGAAVVGFKFGPVWAGEITFNKFFPLNGSFNLGFGAGVRFGKTLSSVSTKMVDNVKTSVERESQKEIDVPVYLRLNYGLDKLYFNCDLGYSFGFEAYGPTPAPGASYEPKPHYSGFFVEPKAGYRLSDKFSLALGLRLHQTDCGDSVYYYETGSDMVIVDNSPHNKLIPAITLRLAKHF